VLRFDKVAYAHPEQVKANRDFIAADGYLPHALAAIQSIRNHPAIDQKRLFLAGHSLGGTVAPRVAAAEPSLAGTVIRAGGTEPLHWAAVPPAPLHRVPQPTDPSGPGSMIDTMTALAERVDSPDLSSETPPASFPSACPRHTGSTCAAEPKTWDTKGPYGGAKYPASLLTTKV
jgi:uncharacterized protein